MRSSTLFVVVVDDGSRSEAMALAHVRAGRCHPRVLLYVPGEAGRSDADVLAVIEQAASGLPRTGLAGVLPHHLELDLVQDLGELMAARKPFARLLYAAATTEWSEWGDLGRKLHYSVGVPRNINVDLGEALRRAAIISDNSPWSQPRLAQFAAEHRRFIVAFATGHLAFESHVEAA